MEMDVNENGTVVLKKVYNPILFSTEEGNVFSVCMRDDGIEIMCNPNKKNRGWISIAGDGSISQG